MGESDDVDRIVALRVNDRVRIVVEEDTPVGRPFGMPGTGEPELDG